MAIDALSDYKGGYVPQCGRLNGAPAPRRLNERNELL